MAGNDRAALIQACALRATRLRADGSIAYGDTAMIVTDALVSFAVSHEMQDGEEITLTSGCGDIQTQYYDPPRYKRSTGTLTINNHDVELEEMTTGGALITSGGRSIGFAVPAVGEPAHAGVLLELWSKAWVKGAAPAGENFTDAATTATDATLTSATATFTAADVGKEISGAGIPAGTRVLSVTSATEVELTAAATATATGVAINISRPGRFWRTVVPKFVGNVGEFTLENAGQLPQMMGPMFENPRVGLGPLGDFPPSAPVGRTVWKFRDDALPTIPTPYGYQTLSA